MLTSKLDAIKALKGGPKTIQQEKAVTKSTQDNINNLYFLDKVLRTGKFTLML